MFRVGAALRGLSPPRAAVLAQHRAPPRRFCANGTPPPPPSPPPRAELKKHFIVAAVPMVGFGFMDNLVMIQAGDLIDNTLGVRFGLATLTAAAFGQVARPSPCAVRTVASRRRLTRSRDAATPPPRTAARSGVRGLPQVFSDVSGVAFGGVVDAACLRLGLPTPTLSAAQRALPVVRRVGTAGAIVGVIIGCLLGMTSLLWLDLEAAERKKKASELRTLFDVIVREARDVLGCERATLWMLDDDLQVT